MKLLAKINTNTANDKRLLSFAIQVLVVVVNGIGNYACAGNLDSLLSAYQARVSPDSIKVKLAIKLADAYRPVNTDSAVYYATEAKSTAKKINDLNGSAGASVQLGAIYGETGDRDKALASYTQALRIYTLNKNRKQLAIVLNNMGALYFEWSYYHKALDCFMKSLKIRELLGNQADVAASYTNLGATYKEAGKYPEALDHFFKALKLAEALNQDVTTAMTMANIANVYALIGKHTESLDYANRSLIISKRIGDASLEVHALGIIGQVYYSEGQYPKAEQIYKEGLLIATDSKEGEMIADFNAGLGMIYCETKKYDQALYYYGEAKKWSEKINNVHYLSQSYLGLGEVNLLLNKRAASIQYLEKGLVIAKEAGMPTILVEIYGVLAEAYRQANNYNKAHEYLSLYMAFRDSIYNVDEKESMQKLHFDHELYKKRQEIILLENEKTLQAERDLKQRMILSFLLVILCLAALVIYFLINGRRKEKRAMHLIASQKLEIVEQAMHLKELNNLKTRTFSIISHDLRNPIAALNMLIELMNKKRISTDKFFDEMQGINRQLYSLNTVLENLLIWSKSQMEGRAEPSPSRLNLYMLAGQSIALLQESAEQKKVTLINDISPDAVVFADNEHIDIVIRNLVANAIKFTPENGTVVISSFDQGDRIMLVVKDTGVGMTKKIIESLFSYKQTITSFGTKGEKGTGLCLLLCKEFIDKNGGRISVESEEGKGSRFSFDLPKAS